MLPYAERYFNPYRKDPFSMIYPILSKEKRGVGDWICLSHLLEVITEGYDGQDLPPYQVLLIGRAVELFRADFVRLQTTGGSVPDLHQFSLTMLPFIRRYEIAADASPSNNDGSNF